MCFIKTNSMDNIQQQINKLIPYFGSNFISYDLWEEGHYELPFIRFWHPNELELDSDMYLFELEESYGDSTIKNYVLYPNYNIKADGSLLFAYPNWSIEEMLSIIYKLTNNESV